MDNKILETKRRTLAVKLEIIEKRVHARKQLQIYQGQFNACDFVKTLSSIMRRKIIRNHYLRSLKCHPSSLPYPPEEGRAPPLGGKEERTDDISDYYLRLFQSEFY